MKNSKVKVDMSPEAVTRRLRLAIDLGRVRRLLAGPRRRAHVSSQPYSENLSAGGNGFNAHDQS